VAVSASCKDVEETTVAETDQRLEAAYMAVRALGGATAHGGG
jgi:hypothetical protein